MEKFERNKLTKSLVPLERTDEYLEKTTSGAITR